MTDTTRNANPTRKDKAALRADRVRTLRPTYQADLADGTDRFFHPRTTTCPWCKSTQLRHHLTTTDLMQHKPGRFTLDTCTDCGHTFQNPRLNDTGLEFYYRDFYDGLGEERLSNLFSGTDAAYEGRTRLVTTHTPAPANWLDVGTGHGHFPHHAAGHLPDTTFDGLDMTDGVELGHTNGWLTNAHHGQFTELAPTLGPYDVVSMCHYLEHTPDPHRELAAAATVVAPGGHLLIEVPDPHSSYGRFLGRWWLPWLQPQHLHFIPITNLTTALEKLGFTIVARQRDEPHGPIDLIGATWLALNNLAPHTDEPWHPHPPRRGVQTVRVALLLAALPALALAHLGDKLLGRRPGRRSNAYRVLAAREPAPTQP